jgi:hypothetical protein
MHEFEHYAALAFFASAWADAADDADNGPNMSGCEIMDIMPDGIDPAAIHAARTLRMDIERINGATVDELMARIEDAADGDRPSTLEYFGHYAAMQAMGHGVGLHDAFGSEVYETVKVPYVEFGQHSLERDYF